MMGFLGGVYTFRVRHFVLMFRLGRLEAVQDEMLVAKVLEDNYITGRRCPSSTGWSLWYGERARGVNQGSLVSGFGGEIKTIKADHGITLGLD